jgi:hypothetical protein
MTPYSTHRGANTSKHELDPRAVRAWRAWVDDRMARYRHELDEDMADSVRRVSLTQAGGPGREP